MKLDHHLPAPTGTAHPAGRRPPGIRAMAVVAGGMRTPFLPVRDTSWP